MILETAFFKVQPDRVDEFIEVLPGALELVRPSAGFLGVDIQRGVERPDTVLLTLRWRTLEDHTVGFRESEMFPKWRAIISPFFAEPPVVEHWQIAD